MPYAVKPKAIVQVQGKRPNEPAPPHPGYEYWILNMETGKTEGEPFPDMETAKIECERLNEAERRRN